MKYAEQSHGVDLLSVKETVVAIEHRYLVWNKMLME